MNLKRVSAFYYAQIAVYFHNSLNCFFFGSKSQMFWQHIFNAINCVPSITNRWDLKGKKNIWLNFFLFAFMCEDGKKCKCKRCKMQNNHRLNGAKSMQMVNKITVICGTRLCFFQINDFARFICSSLHLKCVWCVIFVCLFIHSIAFWLDRIIVSHGNEKGRKRKKMSRNNDKRNCHLQNIWFDTSSSVYWLVSIYLLYMVYATHAWREKAVCSIWLLCNARLQIYALLYFLLQSCAV